MLDIKSINEANNHKPAYEKLCIVNTPQQGKLNRLKLVNNGQGDGDTKWKGCPWKVLLFKLDIHFFFATLIQIIVKLDNRVNKSK